MTVLESQIGDYQKRLSARTSEKDRAHSWFNLGLVLAIMLGPLLAFGYFAEWPDVGWLALSLPIVFVMGGLVSSWRRVRRYSDQGLIVPDKMPGSISLTPDGFQFSTEVEVMEIPWSKVRRARYVDADAEYAEEVRPYGGCLIIDISGTDLTVPDNSFSFDLLLEAARERTEFIRQPVIG